MLLILMALMFNVQLHIAIKSFPNSALMFMVLMYTRIHISAELRNDLIATYISTSISVSWIAPVGEADILEAVIMMCLVLRLYTVRTIYIYSNISNLYMVTKRYCYILPL